MSAPGPDKDLLYYEDFVVDEPFETGSYEVTAEEIIAFAREYDPLPFQVGRAS